MNTKMWVQIVGSMFFVAIALAEATGLKSPTFRIELGWVVFALAAAAMGFEAWRTWRKAQTETEK